MTDTIIQTGLFLTSGATVWLLTSNRIFAGSVIGLISEAFWFISAYSAHQWGVFAIAIWYTFCYGKAVYNNYK